MAKESPATSCMALKTLKSGTYWLKNAKGAVFQTYCDNDNTEGGWSYAATFTSNGPRSEWNFYSDQWVRGVTSTLVFRVFSFFLFFWADGRVIRICIRRHHRQRSTAAALCAPPSFRHTRTTKTTSRRKHSTASSSTRCWLPVLTARSSLWSKS